MAEGSGAEGTEGGGALKERLASEMRQALKGREEIRLSALRLLSSAIHYREVELGRDVSENEFVDVARKEVKRRREAVDAYRSAGREDRAQREAQEQEILGAYLPAGLTDEQVDALIDEAVAATGATGPGEVGKVMGFVMGRARGLVDGAVVQEKVRRRLGA